jgi:hypothetical protein
VPAAGDHVWRWFIELDASRAHNGFVPLRLTFTEIAAFADLRGLTIRDWELDAIREMDGARMTQLVAATGQGSGATQVATRTLTPALFDAVFG